MTPESKSFAKSAGIQSPSFAGPSDATHSMQGQFRFFELARVTRI